MNSFLACVLMVASGARAELPGFDFAREEQARQWRPEHDIASAKAAADGLEIQIGGEDPYLVGPARNYPPGVRLRAELRLYSEQGGMVQIFYFADHPSEADSVRIAVPAGRWTTARANLPALGPGYRLRIDPPGAGGTCTIRSLRFTAALSFSEPAWPPPHSPAVETSSISIASGPLRVVHGGKEWGALRIDIDAKPTAIGWAPNLIGYLEGTKPLWVRTDSAPCRVRRDGPSLVEETSLTDAGGASWRLKRTFTPLKPGAIDVVTVVSVSQDRQVIFLPLVGVFPGVGSFGPHKTQALLAGLEYLDRDEPSSSEADVIGPASKRQVPDSLKITFPLMALAADGRWVGLTWEQGPDFAAVFDSPDRLFHSGGSAMGIIFPGSDGADRIEGSLLPLEPGSLEANKPLTLRATIVGGVGNDVTPAVRQYVALRGLPPAPRPMGFDAYVQLASAGWLDSKIHRGALYRHAIPGQFEPHPAADAATWQDWLASQASDGALKAKLTEAARIAIAQVPPDAYNFAAVSHVNPPAEALVYGHVEEAAEAATRQGTELLGRFEPDGSVHYHPGPSGEDLGKTHFAPDANGLTATLVERVLEDAAFSGDPTLTRQGLRLLDALDKFAGTVPRGAQTWEVPLHTPDILASAHLVRAYTLGYELTGKSRYLDQAKYWAWTGVPFVYLTAPAEPVGPYAGIAVFGATQWKAPVWMGLPVQWCAVVYADALYQLAPHDAGGPWKKLADGITASGIQQTWPAGSDAMRQGLLPDSFNLHAQSRNNPAINPGTLESVAVRFFNRVPVYEFHSFRDAGLLVHVPGRLLDASEERGHLTCDVQSWAAGKYYVLIGGLTSAPRVWIDGAPLAAGDSRLQFVAPKGRLVLQLAGRRRLEIRVP